MANGFVPFEVDLADNPGKVRFSSEAELIDWVRNEKEAWDSAIAAMAPEIGGTPRETLQNVLTTRAELFKQAQDLGREQDTERKKQVTDIIKARLRNYTEGDILHHKSLLGIYILKLYEVDKSRAARTLAAYLQYRASARMRLQGPHVNFVTDPYFRFQFPEAIEGYIELGLFRRGITPDLSALRSAHEALLDEHRNAFVALKAETETAKNAHVDAVAELTKQRERETAEMDGVLQRRDTEISSFMDGVKKRTGDLEDLLKRRLYFEAPVNYWDEKRRNHLAASWGFGLLFIFSIIGLILICGTLLVSNWSEIVAFVEAHGSTMTSPTLALIFIPLVFVAWVLRLLHRVFTTNLSLLSDASERVAMVKTFLALINEHAANETDRILILQALFRPSAAAGDEGAPPHWFDLLMQRISSEKK